MASATDRHERPASCATGSDDDARRRDYDFYRGWSAKACRDYEEDRIVENPKTKIDAFFIAMPQLPFEDALRIGLSSVAETAFMAWRKHIGIREGIEVSLDNREIGRRIQAWFDKGYRVKRVTISEST